MIRIKLSFETSDVQIIDYPGTLLEAESYFLNHIFQTSLFGRGILAKVIKITAISNEIC